MAHLENTVTTNKAVGATLKEVPSFVLSEWGPKIKKFVKASSDFSAAMAFLKTLKNESGVDLNQHDTSNTFPQGMYSFFTDKKEGVTLMISPKIDEVVISQEVSAEREKSFLKKSVYIRMDDNCLVKDVAFIETFEAPNTDTALRVVEVELNPGGKVEKVRDMREIESKISYVASGLPRTPQSLTVADGRRQNNSIIYAWDENNPEPLIEHVEDVEKSFRTDIHLYPFQLKSQKSKTAETGITTVEMGIEIYPYGYLSKMLPPDKSIAKLFHK